MRTGLCDLETARFYLYRSLRRKIYKANKHQSFSSQEWEEASENELPISEPLEENLIHAEIIEGEQAHIISLMNRLSDRQKEAILLHYYENFSYHQVGEIMHINEQSARNLVQRALDKLRRRPVF
jgi:RNA polymerase sigma-70 factor (ECF subfamily)